MGFFHGVRNPNYKKKWVGSNYPTVTLLKEKTPHYEIKQQYFQLSDSNLATVILESDFLFVNGGGIEYLSNSRKNVRVLKRD